MRLQPWEKLLCLVTHLKLVAPPGAVCAHVYAWVAATLAAAWAVLMPSPHWAFLPVQLWSELWGNLVTTCLQLPPQKPGRLLLSLLLPAVFPLFNCSSDTLGPWLRSLWKLLQQRRAAGTPVLPSPNVASDSVWLGPIEAPLGLFPNFLSGFFPSFNSESHMVAERPCPGKGEGE